MGQLIPVAKYENPGPLCSWVFSRFGLLFSDISSFCQVDKNPSSTLYLDRGMHCTVSWHIRISSAWQELGRVCVGHLD